MKNCPVTGNPCECDKVFKISEKIREFTYSTECCRNCVHDYVQLRNEAAVKEMAQLETVDQIQNQIQNTSTPSPTSNHSGVLDLLAMLGIDIAMFDKPVLIEKIGTVKNATPADTKRCPGCECTVNDLRKMKKMGCPTCYSTFSSELEDYLPKIQGGKKTHKGKRPTTPEPEVKLPAKSNDLVKILEEQMAQAISDEDYEKASKCRDLIKKYSGEN